MTAFKAKGTFEFLLANVSKMTRGVYSPPFGTHEDMFWQLEFTPSCKDDPEYCSVYLCAIANSEEKNSTEIWTRRNEISATLFLRVPASDPSTSLDNTLNIRKSLSLDDYSATFPLWGFDCFCKRSVLPDEIMLGVIFDKTEFTPWSMKTPFPTKPIPDPLIDAWSTTLNKQETVDVQFNVKGTLIYASSTILSKRSEYFQKVFQEKWSESQKKAPKQRQNSISGSLHSSSLNNNNNESTSTSLQSSKLPQAVSSPPNGYKFVVDVPDFDHATFLEMLRFLYTDQVLFDDKLESHKSALGNLLFPHLSQSESHDIKKLKKANSVKSQDLFAIADKYLIADLRQRAKVKIFKDLNEDNAAGLLFGAAWKWPDLKEHVMKYVVENFKSVRKTPAFKNAILNPSSHPHSGELFIEVLEILDP
ncbi:2239_t:CDS:2 [Ambispora gerdemannii]|uniref:2239_t:CDS:1 n=1 Tax=Ambispora gerdemannii TaxID=144530 RepID=A0A9N9DQF9_9GLOM|nr:2239_t:CDS:2 [Ambispora gerdemannii]